jgi:Uma2 family endonuclease
MNIDVSSLSLPIRLRPATALTDEELMRFSRKNRPYKIERDKQGEITVRTPVGGIGSTHEVFVASTLYLWNETTGGGVAFGSNAGFNLRDGSCLSPDAAWLSIERWTALSAEQRTDSRRLLEAKMQLWLDNGAELAWLLDPIDGQALIYIPGETVQTLNKPHILSGSQCVAGFQFPFTRLWSTG